MWNFAVEIVSKVLAIVLKVLPWVGTKPNLILINLIGKRYNYQIKSLKSTNERTD
jgi:hypothetical protein